MRNLHKGVVYKNDNEDFKNSENRADNDFAPEKVDDKEVIPQEDYDVEDFNAYREAEEAQKREDDMEVDPKNVDTQPKKQTQEPSKENKAKDNDSEDLGDLEDILSDGD